MRQMNRKVSLFLLILLTAICFGQFKKSIDFVGYLAYVSQAAAMNFSSIPYPGEQAVVGQYFQSPLVTQLLVPFTWISLSLAKLLWAALNLAGLAYVTVSIFKKIPSISQIFFLALIFAHPLSDVFLSGNINAPLLLSLYLGWQAYQKQSRRGDGVAGACWALAINIKLLPFVLLAFVMLDRRWRVVMSTCFFLLLEWGITAFLFGRHTLDVWLAWLRAVGQYSQAATPNWVAFQSPPAMLYRYLVLLKIAPHELAFSIEKIFALAVMGAGILGMLWLRKRRAHPEGIVAIGMSLFYWGSPFSWASALLFTLPLFAPWFRSRIPRIAWVVALLLAALPKDLWPATTWDLIAQWSLPGLCLAGLHFLALKDLFQQAEINRAVPGPGSPAHF